MYGCMYLSFELSEIEDRTLENVGVALLHLKPFRESWFERFRWVFI